MKLINWLLGLIVYTKVLEVSYLTRDGIMKELLRETGVEHSNFNSEITNLKTPIFALRYNIANFDIHFDSENDEFLIDRILFKDSNKGMVYVIASFIPSELLNFIRYYSSRFVDTISKHKKEIYVTA